MASKSSSIALLLTLYIIFFSLVIVSSCNTCPPTPNPNPKPKPIPKPTPSPRPSAGSCLRDTLKLGVCADLLGGLLDITIGTPPKMPCCSLVRGLADLEAAACLCTVVKANVLGVVNLNIPVSLSLLVNYCGKRVPSEFQCV